MTAKFTKGPWRVNEDLPADIHSAETGELLASTYPLDNTDGDCHANAKLIAASPTMLEALKRITSLNLRHPLSMQMIVADIEFAREAIRLAEEGR